MSNSLTCALDGACREMEGYEHAARVELAILRMNEEVSVEWALRVRRLTKKSLMKR